MSNPRKYKVMCLPLAMLTLLAGCGDNSKEVKEEVVNSIPTVSVSNVTTNEGTTATLVANADDKDGKVVSYLWQKVSGPDITLSNLTESTLKITAPQVDENTTWKFKVTVTDDKGASSSDEAMLTVNDLTKNMVIKGKITDGPIANAKVSIQVGSAEPVKVQADENGDYSATLRYEETNVNDFVKITATGAEDNSIVRLISNVGSLQSLIDKKDAANQVTQQQVFALNVTNVTTATDALMKIANAGNDIDTLKEFDQTSMKFEPNLIMPLATAIKMVIDYSGKDGQSQETLTNVPGLPAGVADTAALVQNMETVQSYLDAAIQAAPESHKQALADINADPNLITNNVGTVTEQLGDFYLKAADERFEGERITLAAGGTGTFTSNNLQQSPTNISWEANDQGLEITYGAEGIESHDRTVTDDNLPSSPYKVMRMKTTFKMLATATHSAQVVVQHEHKFRLESDGAESAATTPQYEAQLIKESGVVNPQSVIDAGIAGTYSIPVPGGMDSDQLRALPSYVDDPYLSKQRSIMKLNIDASGNASLTRFVDNDGKPNLTGIQVPATISFDDNHLKASVAGLPVEFDFAFFTDQSPYMMNGMLSPVIATPDLKPSPISSYALKKQADIAWTAQNAQGIYALSWDMLSPLDKSWIELQADNTLLYVRTADSNFDSELSNDEFTITSGRWTIEDGKLMLKRYSSALSNENTTAPIDCQPEGFDTSTDLNCKTWFEAEWDLHNIQGNEYSVTQAVKYFEISVTLPEASPYTGSNIVQHIDNRKYTKRTERPIAIPASLLPNSN
ncbi:MAG: PKD domain-containing protein [Parashewanella sp.]